MKTLYGRAGVTTLAALGLALAAASAQAQTVFTGWDFNNNAFGTGSQINTSPTASIGSGTANSLGMTNNYGTPGPSMDISDILNTNPTDDTSAATDQGSSDPNQLGNIWRIRGGQVTGNPALANGWSSLAPQYTQGAQFLVSTVGESNISLSYDWLPTKRGVADLQLQYTTDGSTWNNAGSVLTATSSKWYDNNTFDFSSITAANNDPNFGVRMVSAYDPTTGTYLDTTGAALNNTSGNWRFDEVNFTGTSAVAAPEPSQFAGLTFFLLGVSALAFRARKRANTAA